MTALQFEKIPTTSVRQPIPLFNCSSGFLQCNYAMFGWEGSVGQDVILGVFEHLSGPGELRPVNDSGQLALWHLLIRLCESRPYPSRQSCTGSSWRHA